MRRVSCRSYDKCLDSAARRDGDFKCGNCGRFQAADPELLSWRQIEAFISLLLAVFHPPEPTPTPEPLNPAKVVELHREGLSRYAIIKAMGRKHINSGLYRQIDKILREDQDDGN